MGRRFPQGGLRGCRWSTANPSPAGTPARRRAFEAALAGFRESVPASQMLRWSSHAVPDGGGAFPFGRLFPTAHRICNLQSARMVMDSNQKTIKGAQSVYRVLNILEEVILCGDRMITPKELSVSLDIPVATVHRLLTVLRQKIFVACDLVTKKYPAASAIRPSSMPGTATTPCAWSVSTAGIPYRFFSIKQATAARSAWDRPRFPFWPPCRKMRRK